MTEPLFVDTNVWVCAVDAADPAKRERALEVIAPTRGRELLLSTQVSIWDALILRAAEVAGCRRVLSDDLADGATYGSVVVENPFR